MSSDRPESSAAPNSEPAELSKEPVANDEGIIDERSLPIVGSNFVPNVFDAVIPTHRARDTAKQYIPPVFLQSEAVDSSLLLGSGASFVVTRQAIPPGPTEIKEKVDMGDWSVEKVVKAPKRPEYIVYKSARVQFREDGDPATRKDRYALQSVLTEFHALLHPPFLKHENIIDFLGLAWGSNHADPLHQLPVLVVEYGDLGTLADVQQRQTLAPSLKVDLCLGIARGLETLHLHGIVHGDVKPENIIMCSQREKTMVPKLADFGFAIIEATEPPDVTIGGSKSWRAPESYGPIPSTMLNLADVYSFGLVLWSVAIDGKDPWSLMLPDTCEGEERLKEINRLKGADEIIALSKLEKWVLNWAMQSRLRELLARLQLKHPQSSPNTERETPILRMIQTVLSPLQRGEEAPNELSPALQQMMGVSTSKLYKEFSAQTLFKDLDAMFSLTLGKDPTSRNLSAVIQLLEVSQVVSSTKDEERDIGNSISGVKNLDLEGNSDESKDISSNESPTVAYSVTNTSTTTKHFSRAPITWTPQSQPAFNEESALTRSTLAKPSVKISGTEIPLQKIDWSKLGFKNHRYSWQMIRDLEPRVQSFVVKTLFQLDDPSRQFSLTAFLYNGYGVLKDEDRGLEMITKAAQANHSIAQAYLYRLFTACSKPIPSEIPVLKYLQDQALRGSRMALEDLKKLDSAQAAHARELMKFGYGGVGANWFLDDEWLHGLTQSTLLNKDFSLEKLSLKYELADFIVNKRGDNIIHAAAAVGAFTLLQTLVTEFQVDINKCNKKGETALLCACRSGHPGSVKFLLDRGALASIQSTDGESPLHWLLSFEFEKINVAALGKDLIQRGGAVVDAFTARPTSHSLFPGSIDVDFQAQGTPLMWATHNNQPRLVSFLLSMGANPNWRLEKDFLSPLEWAAYYHHTVCLKIMIDHLENTATVPNTTEGKRDLRHAVFYGPLVRNALHASDKFSMIIRNGTNYLTNLKSTLALLQEKTKLVRFNLGQYQTPLHFAAREAHDETCEVILELGWFTDDINIPAGPEKRTPLLESVHWNRPNLFRLLRNHGADIHALCMSPFEGSEQRTWSALHVMANQAQNNEFALVDEILAAGLPVDGNPEAEMETAFNIAVRRNGFKLAEKLRTHGANPDVIRKQSALLIAPYPLTVLGHEIARNARYGLAAIRYLLALRPRPSFIVEPERGLTALHLVAMVPDGFTYVGGGELNRADFDWETNCAIAQELRTWFTEPNELNAQCLQGKTALHLAAERGNALVVEELVRAGASLEVRCEVGERPADIARRWFGEKGQEDKLRKLLEWLE